MSSRSVAVAIGPTVSNAGVRDVASAMRRAVPVGERPWIERKACLNCDPGVFFVRTGENANQAKRICRSCPVRRECLDWALAAKPWGGIYGGMSEKERKWINRGRG